MVGVHVEGALTGTLNKADDAVGLKGLAGLLPLFHVGGDLYIVLVKQILVNPQVAGVYGAHTQALQNTVHGHGGYGGFAELILPVVAQSGLDGRLQVDGLAAEDGDAAIGGAGGNLKGIHTLTVGKGGLQRGVVVVDGGLLPGHLDVGIQLVEFRNVAFVGGRAGGPAPPHNLAGGGVAGYGFGGCGGRCGRGASAAGQHCHGQSQGQYQSKNLFHGCSPFCLFSAFLPSDEFISDRAYRMLSR